MNDSCCHGKQRMKGVSWIDEIAKTGSWTCHRCLRGRQKPVAHLAAYTTNSGKSPPWTFTAQRASQPRRSSYESAVSQNFKFTRSILNSFPSKRPTLKDSAWKKVPVSKGKRRGVILAIFAIGSIWALFDDAKHNYGAAKRALRVFNALVRCLREYVLPSVV